MHDVRRNKNKFSKVFGIGLGHTGTRSLTEALRILGIQTIHWPLDYTAYQELKRGCYRLSILEKYQAITDITVAPFYAQLDREFPGSKFILTLRDRKSWYKSMRKVNAEDWIPASKKWLVAKTWQILQSELRYRSAWKKIFRIIRYVVFFRSELYRVTSIEFQRLNAYHALAFEKETMLLDIYDQHKRDVLEYFKDRPHDLLVIDICAGEGWEKLCPFLSRPVPNDPFPYVKHRRR